MKKKTAILLAGILLAQSFLGGCGSSVSKDANGVSYNNAYNDKKLVTTNGTEVILTEHADDLTMQKTTGLGYVEPESWKNIVNRDGLGLYELDPIAYVISYLPKEQLDRINAIDENMPEEEQEKIYSEAFDLEYLVCGVVRSNEEDEKVMNTAEYYKSFFENEETIASVGKDTFYFVSNTEMPEEGFSEEDKNDLRILIQSYDTLKDNIILFPPTNPMDDFKVDLSEFTAKDMDGNEVTADIFKDYDVTMVNIWATWCGPCIREMPEIEALYEELPENVNIITICDDAASERETALEELAQVGATFTTIERNEELDEKVMTYVTAFPTTFFVDKNGKVIGKLQVGAPGNEGEIKDGYRALIDAALESK